MSPVLIIRGKDYEVFEISLGRAIYEHYPWAVEPLWVQGAGHNDFEHFDELLVRLLRFTNYDLRIS
jgi:pimeloyl-ACP methyl ester carboxylesterase